MSVKPRQQWAQSWQDPISAALTTFVFLFCVASYFNIILIFQALKMHAGQGLTRSLCLSPQCGHIMYIFLPFIINLYLLIGL